MNDVIALREHVHGAMAALGETDKFCKAWRDAAAHDAAGLQHIATMLLPEAVLDIDDVCAALEDMCGALQAFKHEPFMARVVACQESFAEQYDVFVLATVALTEGTPGAARQAIVAAHTPRVAEARALVARTRTALAQANAELSARGIYDHADAEEVEMPPLVASTELDDDADMQHFIVPESAGGDGGGDDEEYLPPPAAFGLHAGDAGDGSGEEGVGADAEEEALASFTESEYESETGGGDEGSE
jgi:hypothetical protein